MFTEKNKNIEAEELISRKDFLKKTGFSVFAGLFAIKALANPINASAATVKDNTTKTGVLGEMNYEDTPVAGSYVTSVSQENGSISVSKEAADTTPTADSQKMVTSGGVKAAIDAEATARGNADTAEATARSNADTALSNRIGTSVGGQAAPVFVNSSGQIAACNGLNASAYTTFKIPVNPADTTNINLWISTT